VGAADVPILHLDDDLVAVGKPGGLLVHRTTEAPDRRVLLQTVRDVLGRRLYPVHRLDRAASGVIVFALSPEIARGLQAALAAPGAEKEYLALVRGEIEPEGVTDRPLTDEKGVRRQALTRWRREETIRGFSLIRVWIETGRRHQIRRHLAHLAHQIVGDTTHGKGRINRWLREAFGLPRLFLHAARLAFDHPATGDRLEVKAPLADDLAAFLERFREGESGELVPGSVSPASADLSAEASAKADPLEARVAAIEALDGVLDGRLGRVIDLRRVWPLGTGDPMLRRAYHEGVHLLVTNGELERRIVELVRRYLEEGGRPSDYEAAYDALVSGFSEP
jgi:tRNA pseudouridine65 synthase